MLTLVGSAVKAKLDAPHLGRTRLMRGLFAVALVALVFVSLELPHLFRLRTSAQEEFDWNLRTTIDLKRRPQARELKAEEEIAGKKELQAREEAIRNSDQPGDKQTENTNRVVTGISGALEENTNPGNGTASDGKRKASNSTKVRSLRRAAQLAWKDGRRAWKELQLMSTNVEFQPRPSRRETSCPKSFLMDQQQIEEAHHYMPLPCGLTVGSSITVVGKPRPPHFEYKPSIGRISDDGSPSTEVSQFILELHGPRESSLEEPPRILHINPRLKGDWSDKPVVELNSYYHGQWGVSQRCDGTHSQYQDTVDGLSKCEKWLQDKEAPEPSWWLRRLIGRMDKPEMNWPYPFAPDRSFVLTVQAGFEGYHMSVDGRHITSFPFATGLLEEDTAGTYVGGDVDLQAIIATSLPSSPPRSLDEQVFENWELWRAPKLRRKPKMDLFIGVLSASNHFAERMAIRSTWFQAKAVQSTQVVARFFVAMHADRDINMQMKKEADYYGDMVIVPFMDYYDLVVLKTLAICEFAVRNVSTKYIMKCDDDTFIRVDAVLNELKTVGQAENLYLGNMNMYHRPLRTGKWAVTFEEWPDEEYPTYANGPGYIISQNISRFIFAQNRKKSLELFKMEDVSMGLWVKQFHYTTDSVQYVHSWKFYQAGCENGYITAHYQSPHQMLCMWKKLLKGQVQCCS